MLALASLAVLMTKETNLLYGAEFPFLLVLALTFVLVLFCCSSALPVYDESLTINDQYRFARLETIPATLDR